MARPPRRHFRRRLASSFTGEWLSREDGRLRRQHPEKLAPRLTPASRVLEVGCASGISMFRLAPLVAEHVGTDLSPTFA